MRYLIDSADPAAVKRIMEYYPTDGVTTNPHIVAVTKCDYKQMLTEMRKVVGDKMIHVQTLQTEASAMVEEALALREFVGEPFFIKLPANPEGLKACRILREKGVGVTMTAIFSPQQALLCARAGASFVAPYMNKLSDVGEGLRCIERIRKLLSNYSLDTKVLAASYRNVDQVTDTALYGSDYITLPPEFFQKLLWHPMTDLAIRGFEEDWEGVYGEKKPIDLIK